MALQNRCSLNVTASWCQICSDEEGPDDASQGQGRHAGMGDILAMMYCENCGQTLCHRCGSRHTRQRFAANHNVVELNQLDAAQGHDCSPSMCTQHQSEPLVVYCRDCRELGCLLCLSLEAHQGHRWCDVDTASEETRKNLSRHLEQVRVTLDEHRGAADKQQRSADAMEHCLSVANTQLRVEVEKLHQDLDRCMEELQCKLEAAGDQKTQMENRRVELVQRTERLSNFVAQCQQVINSKSAIELIRSSSELITEATQLVNIKAENDLCSSFRVVFTPTNFRQYLPQTDINLVGAISVDHTTDAEGKNELIHRSVSKNQQKGEHYFVFGSARCAYYTS